MVKFSLKELCFEVTSDCFLQCCFCSSFNDRDRVISPSYIDIDMFEEVVTTFRDLGGELLEISGGEPLLHPLIARLVQIAKEKDLQVRLYTSGVTYFDVSRLVRSLADAGLDCIIFNCQGLSEVHDRLVGMNGVFEWMFNALKCSKDAGLWVGVHFIPMRPNIPQIESLFQLLEAYKVDEVAFLRLVKQGRATSNFSFLTPKLDDYKLFVDVIRKLLRKSGSTRIRLGCPFQALKARFQLWDNKHCGSLCCHAGKSSLSVLPSGRVIPCPAFKDIPSACLGNIFKDSLKKIWQGSPFLQKLRKPLFIPHCIACVFWNECHGGCAAQRFLAHNGFADGPDPLCLSLERQVNV